MSPTTIVLKLDAEAQRALGQSVERAGYEFHSVAHARFSVRTQGLVATLYNSGKLVIQGPGAEGFQLRHLGATQLSCPAAESPSQPGRSATALCPAQGPLVGSDECGKGDYFGPLVVCALRVPANLRASLATSGVADSKQLSDRRILELSGPLEANYEFAIEFLEPEAYNQEYERVRNLNPMLADLHARAIRRVARPGDVLLVDRFADESMMVNRLKEDKIELYQAVGAEREPAVAAASILARAFFLQALEQLSADYAVRFHKGAGAPTDRAGVEFLRLHGAGKLAKVAKLHFKNTSKILP